MRWSTVCKREAAQAGLNEGERENAASAGDTHIYIIYTLDINDIL